jgi:hypothetical protein
MILSGKKYVKYEKGKTLSDSSGVRYTCNKWCQYSMDLGEDWSNNEIIQAVAIGEFTNLDGIEWRNGAETTADEILMRLQLQRIGRLLWRYKKKQMSRCLL